MKRIKKNDATTINVYVRRAMKTSPEHNQNPYSHLSEEERLRQIGELLHLAARLYWRRERLAGRAATSSPAGEPAPSDIADLGADEAEKKILRCLAVLVSASPKQIRASLGIAHSTLARKLARLRAAGHVIVCGKTKGARYELRHSP